MQATKNSKLVQILNIEIEARAACVRASEALEEAQSTKKKISTLYANIRSNLARIEIKKEAKQPLTAQERALWAIYGKEDLK